MDLRALFARSDDPYAGGDLVTARRLGAVLGAVAGGYALLLLPLSPPTAAIGGWGWLVAAASVAVAMATVAALARGGVGWNTMLVLSYVGVGQVALAHWLCGDASPYGEMYLLVAVFAGAVHPPRRVVGVLAAIAVLAPLPLAYGGWDAQLGAQTTTRLLLWSALALLASALMAQIRAQRLGLRDRGERAEALARVDELTGLPNRRAFEEALAAEISRARRAGAPVSLVMGDLDGFKAINDMRGHLAGDQCLRDVAAALRDRLRTHDACFRWGGDEFAVLLPETTRAEADAACVRLREAVETRCGVGITCAGTQLTDGMTGEDLIRATDHALLDLKARRGAPLRVVG
jgi:diguanylate cyclase (GGDEF)-like protein